MTPHSCFLKLSMHLVLPQFSLLHLTIPAQGSSMMLRLTPGQMARYLCMWQTAKGPHPHGVVVRKLLLGEVCHGTRPVHAQMDWGNDPVAVQHRAALLADGLQPLGSSPPRDCTVVVATSVPAIDYTLKIPASDVKWSQFHAEGGVGIFESHNASKKTWKS